MKKYDWSERNWRGKQDNQQEMSAFICQRCITLENRGFFYLSGSRLAMEKIDLHSFEKGLIYKILNKNNNQQETC